MYNILKIRCHCNRLTYLLLHICKVYFNIYPTVHYLLHILMKWMNIYPTSFFSNHYNWNKSKNKLDRQTECLETCFIYYLMTNNCRYRCHIFNVTSTSILNMLYMLNMPYMLNKLYMLNMLYMLNVLTASFNNSVLQRIRYSVFL